MARRFVFASEFGIGSKGCWKEDDENSDEEGTEEEEAVEEGIEENTDQEELEVEKEDDGPREIPEVEDENDFQEPPRSLQKMSDAVPLTGGRIYALKLPAGSSTPPWNAPGSTKCSTRQNLLRQKEEANNNAGILLRARSPIDAQNFAYGPLAANICPPLYAADAAAGVTSGEGDGMANAHRYAVTIQWTGNTGTGTSSYRSYGRQHEISAAESKPPIAGSSDPAFRGDASRWNPEELLVAALSACHQLAYLHLCAQAGVVVVAYSDTAEGVMEMSPDGSGRFKQVTLHPRVTVTAQSNVEKARELHHDAHAKCFIASSVNFPVENHPEVTIA